MADDARLRALNVPESETARTNRSESALRISHRLRRVPREHEPALVPAPTAAAAAAPVNDPEDPDNNEGISQAQYLALAKDERGCLRRTLCSVCMERCADVALITCGHVFCGTCVDDSFRPNPRLTEAQKVGGNLYVAIPEGHTCPNCRDPAQGFERVRFP